MANTVKPWQTASDEKNIDFEKQPNGLESFENSTMTIVENDDYIGSSDDVNDKNFSYFNMFCFGIAGMPYHLMFSAISVYSTKFLLDEARIPAKDTSIILFVSRAVDAITDPIYGHLINMSPVTRFGKLKPWIFVSSIISLIVYLLLWYLPEFNKIGLIIWYAIMFSFYFTFITGQRIPHTSMTMYLSKSKRKRELATVFRMGFEMTGILLSLVIQGFIVGSTSSNCEKLDSISNSNSSLLTTQAFETTFQNSYLNNTTKKPSALQKFYKEQPYFVAALVIVSVFVITQILLLLGTTENRDLHAQARKERKAQPENESGALKDFRLVLTFKPFLLLAAAAVSTTTAAQIVQSYFQLYFEYAFTGASSLFSISIIIFLALAILCVPLWKFLMNKLGKKRTYMIGNLLLIPCLIGTIFFKERFHVYIFFPLAVIGANTLTCAFVVPWSMLPECMDHFYLIHKRKPDALFYTLFVIGTKIGISVYLGLGQQILETANYLNNVCAEYQPANVDLVLRMLFAPTPIALLLLSTVCVYLYPITQQVVEENSRKLNSMNRPVPTIGGNNMLSKKASIATVDEGVILAAESAFSPGFVEDPHISTHNKTTVTFTLDDDNDESVERSRPNQNLALKKDVVVTRF